MRILLVEDDEQLARGLHQSLRSEGFTANHVTDAKSALLTISTNECDMLILDLSRKEFMLLKVLLEQAGRIQSREQLESKLYEWGEEVASNAVEVHIHNLRKKLPKSFIKTIRGVGYSIKASSNIES